MAIGFQSTKADGDLTSEGWEQVDDAAEEAAEAQATEVMTDFLSDALQVTGVALLLSNDAWPSHSPMRRRHVATRFSSGLLEATDGKASIGRLQVVLPPAMVQTCHLNHLPYATWQRWSSADIRLVPGPQVWERWGPRGSFGVGVRQVQGCTRPGDFMTLDAALLLKHDTRDHSVVDPDAGIVDGGLINETQEARQLELESVTGTNIKNSVKNDMKELIGRSLVAGWARYRWGVFEERGYLGDPLFPPSLPCQLHPKNCTFSPVSSMMQAITTNQKVKFCNVENHDHESRTLQNLACSGRSVSEVIQHHNDLALLSRTLRKFASTEVIKPYSGPKFVDQNEYHVEGDINLDIESTSSNVKASDVSSNESAQQESLGANFNDVFDNAKLKKNDKNSVKNDAVALVNWQLERKKRTVNNGKEIALNDTAEKLGMLPSSASNQSQLLTLPLLNLNESTLNDNVEESSVDEEQAVAEMQHVRSDSNSELETPDVSPATVLPLLTANSPSTNEESNSTTRSSEREPLPYNAIRPDSQGFDGVPLDLFVSPPSVIVVSLDLSQAAIDEVGVETLRGGLLRWIWGLGGGFRLSILASYNNESFPLTLSPLPPSPSTARQLKRSVALLPTEQEAASGVFGGHYCLACGLKQAAEIIAQGGASVDSALVIVAACRPQVGTQERKILDSSGFLLHTIALCSSVPGEFDQLASPHSSWALPLHHGPQDGERKLAKTLQSIMSVSGTSPLENCLVQLHERDSSFERSELQSSGAYQLASGRLHLGTSSSERLLVLSSTSSAKVVEIRDGDGRRLETIRDTGRRFWVEVTSSGEVTYTFKFLTTSLSFPLFIAEDVYERRKSQAGAEVHLRTSNSRHEPLVPGSPPVVVWADVTMDGWPLVGAEVTLTVTHLPSGTASDYSLFDSGNSEPDIRAGDGVYSRYLTRRVSEGRYSLVATARHGPSTTMVTLQPVGTQERKILDSSGFLLHTIALCSSVPGEFDQLASPHSSWALPLNHGPQDGERKLAKTLQSIMSVSGASPLENCLVQLHERDSSFERSELQSSGAYQLASGRLHLGTSSSERLLVLSSTSSAKVVEIRDGDGRRLETIRDTGRRFWVEVTSSGEVTYTFKFLTTSLSFPLFIAEDVYERRKSQAGAEVHLRTSNSRHEPLVPGSPPVVVWADVTMDGWPLVGAEVTLTVTHLPSGTSSDYSLFDSGNSEPDIRAGDGVYSRYLTRRVSEGRYSLVATARHGPSTTMVTLQPDGSVRQSSSGPFFCESTGRTLYVRRVSFEDTAPPSRVTDLTARLVGASQQALVNLSWSAPGGELDHEAASAYELKMYTEWETLTEERFNDSGIAVYCVIEGQRSPPPIPAPYGTRQHCLVSVPFTDLKWHFAIRGLDSSNNTGRVSNIASIEVPKPAPLTPVVASSSSPSAVLMSVESELTSNVSVIAAGGGGGGWRPYVVAGAAVMGLLMVVAATIACICCCKKAKLQKEKDPDRPVYKIYVNNAYIQEDDGEIKVVSNGRFPDEKRSGQVQEWVNSLDKYGNPESGEGIVDGTELRNKASFKYTSPVRFGVLTNGSIMRDATTGSNSSGSSRPSDVQPHDDYKYKDLSETTSDSTTDGLPPSSSSSAATDLPAVPQRDCSPLPVDYSPREKSSSFNTNISSLPLPTLVKNTPSTPPSASAQLSMATPQPNDYTSEEEGGFRPRTSQARGSPIPPRRQLNPQFCSFRYLPPPPQYRTDDEHYLSQQQAPILPHRSCTTQPSPPAPPLSRVNGSLSHGTVRSVKKRRHISFV
ncbi:Calcium-activated chloride channel N-terminal [Trinorchestia longiramus]|nr:Calcium-activated chloride channel N-terminal [Trinorchestia longiramus]